MSASSACAECGDRYSAPDPGAAARQVVQELEAVIAHHVGFLDYRRGDGTALNPIQRLRVLVERYDGNLASKVQTVQRVGGAGSP